MIEGRFINELDIEETTEGCCYWYRVREVLFEPDENPIGEYISDSGRIIFRLLVFSNP